MKPAITFEERVACSTAPAEDESRVAGYVVDALDGAVVRKRIKLLPFGTFTLRDGRGPFTLQDKAHAAAVIAATAQRLGGQDMMIDYDHQSEFGAVPGVGGVAPASGWVKPTGLSVEDDGIWASVEWTPVAEQKMAAREYRYISPLFGADKKTGRITRLFNAGLVNQPAIDGLPAIAAGLQPQKEDMKKLATLLGLPEDATEEQIAAAITALKGDKDQLVACATALGLKDDAKGEDIVAAATATRTQLVDAGKALGLKDDAKGEDIVAAATLAKTGKVDLAKFVPIEGFQELQARVAKLDEDRITAMVDADVEAGKVTPAMRKWAIDLATTDEAKYAAFVQSAPTLLNSGGKLTVKPDGDATTLTDEERQVCAAIGMSEADFLEAKKKDDA